MYVVVEDFTDIATGIEYKKGDTYEVEGVSDMKIDFMLTPNQSRGALIEEKMEPVEEPTDAEEEIVEV